MEDLESNSEENHNNNTSLNELICTFDDEKSHYHISPFHPNCTEEHISNHLLKKGFNTNKIEIKKLVGKSYNISTLTFVSFKLSVDKKQASRIESLDFWPDKTNIQPFIPRNKQVNAEVQSDNFLHPNYSPTCVTYIFRQKIQFQATNRKEE